MGGRRFDVIGVIVKPIVFVACLLPLGLLVYNFLSDNLSPNPISDITNETGVWTLRFLVITLSITPLRKITGWSLLQRFRRMMGLFAYLYVFLHFTTYVYLDQFFDWQAILADVDKRRYITVGFTAFVLLTPLALTSVDSVMRRLGGRAWKRLHKLAYVCAGLGVIHYLWLVKADTQRPLMYGAIVLALLLFRLWQYIASRLGRTRRERLSRTGAAAAIRTTVPESESAA